MTWFAMLYVVLFPMIFCHWAWFSVVSLFPASVAAIGTLAIPVIGVLSSTLMLGEVLGIQEISALSIVVVSVGMVLLSRPGSPSKSGGRGGT
jgi:drug/metabolite transporter (DMT)-like permease